MKATKWQRTISLLLCLLMAMSFLAVNASTVYAEDGSTTTGELPQITSFSYDDGYFYNGTTKRKKTVACKIASTSINNYEKVMLGTIEDSEEPLNFLGEIVFFIDKPVKYDATTGVTTERADYPSRLLIPDEAYSITTQQEVSLDTTIVIAAEKESGADENAPTYKTASYYDLLRYTYEGTVYYYYLVIKPAASEKNTAPNIIEGLGTSSTQEFVVNEPWTIDLSKIFEDKDNDPLTYTVKEGNADAKETGVLYSYTPTSDEGVTLVFTASDGTDVSPEYTVILTCKVLAYHSITASSQGTYEWNTLTQDMGTVAVSVVGDDPTHVSAESTVKITATPRKYVLSDSIYNAKLSHWKVTGVNLTQEQLQSNTLTFNMPDNDVTIIAVFEKAGSVVSLTANTFAGGDVDFRINGQRNQNNSTFDSEQGVHIANVVRDTVIENARITAYLVNGQTYNSGYRLVSWQIKNVSTNTLLAESDGVTYETKPYPGQPVGGESYQAPTFKVDGKSEYSITAIFEAKDYGAVNVTVNDIKMGEATAQVDGGEASSSLTVVYEGVTVKLKATPREGFIFKSWKASYGDDDTQVTIADENAAETTFKMPQTGEKPVNVVAEFAVDPSYLSEDCALTDVTLLDNNGSSIAYYGDQDLTNFTIEVPADTDNAKLAGMILKLTVSDDATVKKSGDTDNWPAAGKACGMELDKAATFTVTAENGDKQDYTVTITRAKSSANEITAAVLLNQTGDTTPFAKAQISGTNIIFTLPSDTNKTDLNSIGLKYLKLTYPESATAKMVDATGKDAYGDADGTAKWRNGDVKCNMSLNTPVKFIITAEDNTPKTYTVEIKYTAPNAPTLSDGSAARSSKTAATVKFTTNEAGTYYYKVVTHGAAAPTADEIVKSTTKGTASAGETTFTLSNLTTDARDVYIVVVSAAGGESAPLKVEIPAYDSGSDTPSTGAYKISVSTPKGGTITTNRTKADAGDEIIVTVTPDNGYQMVSGSLTYTLATKGGETKTITNNRFTMPAGDVSITCKWETATTTAKGITSFSINGVAGAVNNTTNTITITMPRGTDVTKLTPTISTNGVKSLTPGSGETVNFTTSVTYTATMEDGSTKTYTVTVYVEKGTLSDQFWDKLTDFVNQIPWWEYAKHQQSTSSYPKYW